MGIDIVSFNKAVTVGNKATADIASVEAKIIELDNGTLKIGETGVNFDPVLPTDPVNKNYVDNMAIVAGGEVPITKVYSQTAEADQTDFFWTEPISQVTRLVIDEVIDDFTYTVTADTIAASFTSDSEATISEIKNGIADEINNLCDFVTASIDGDDILITADTAGVRFSVSGLTKLTQSLEVASIDGIKYVPDSITVVQNNAILEPSKYTATDRNKIVLNTAANEDDVLMMIAYGGADVYSKGEIDGMLAGGVGSADIELKADKTDVYNRTEIDEFIAPKANSADVYPRGELDAKIADMATLVGTKANAVDILTKTNTTEYSPTSAYEPATKSYVDSMASSGGGNVEITKMYSEVAEDDQTEFFYTEPVAQVDKLVIDVANDTQYDLEINGVMYSFTSDGDATVDEIRDGLVTLVEDDDDSVVTASADGDDVLLTADEAGVEFTVQTVNGATHTNEVANDDGIKYLPGAVTVVVNNDIMHTGFTAADGNKIVLDAGLADDDEVMLIAYGGADVYNKAQIDGKFLGYAIRENVLTKNNVNAYTPTEEYHPATKKFVEDTAKALTVDLVKEADYTTRDRERVWCDTATNGSWTLTLPESPVDYATVIVADKVNGFEDNNLIVARNGATIAGADEDLTVDTNGASMTLVAINNDWKVID